MKITCRNLNIRLLVTCTIKSITLSSDNQGLTWFNAGHNQYFFCILWQAHYMTEFNESSGLKFQRIWQQIELPDRKTNMFQSWVFYSSHRKTINLQSKKLGVSTNGQMLPCFFLKSRNLRQLGSTYLKLQNVFWRVYFEFTELYFLTIQKVDVRLLFLKLRFLIEWLQTLCFHSVVLITITQSHQHLSDLSIPFSI